jgi:hypothetical protein
VASNTGALSEVEGGGEPEIESDAGDAQPKPGMLLNHLPFQLTLNYIAAKKRDVPEAVAPQRKRTISSTVEESESDGREKTDKEPIRRLFHT